MPASSSSAADAGCPESVTNTDRPRLCRSRAAAIPLRAIPTTSTMPLSQFQCRQTEQREDQRRDPETDNDLRFLPTLQLEVMMQRSHQKHAFAARLERHHLDHHGESLENKHAADEDQQQFVLDN